MKKWIPIALIIGLVFVLPVLAVSHEGEHKKDEQHSSGKMFEEGSGSSAVKQSSDHMNSNGMDHKMGSEYKEEGSNSMKMHKDGKEYSDKSMHEGGDKGRHMKMKHRKKEGS